MYVYSKIVFYSPAESDVASIIQLINVLKMIILVFSSFVMYQKPNFVIINTIILVIVVYCMYIVHFNIDSLLLHLSMYGYIQR